MLLSVYALYKTLDTMYTFTFSLMFKSNKTTDPVKVTHKGTIYCVVYIIIAMYVVSLK